MALLQRMGGTTTSSAPNAAFGKLLDLVSKHSADTDPFQAQEEIDALSDFDLSSIEGGDAYEPLRDLSIDRSMGIAANRMMVVEKLNDLTDIGNLVEKKRMSNTPLSSSDQQSVMGAMKILEDNILNAEQWGGKAVQERYTSYLKGFSSSLSTQRALDHLEKSGDLRVGTLQALYGEGADLADPEDRSFDYQTSPAFDLALADISKKLPEIMTRTSALSDESELVRMMETLKGADPTSDDFESMASQLEERARKFSASLGTNFAITDPLRRTVSDVSNVATAGKIVKKHLGLGRTELLEMWKEGSLPESIIAIDRAYHSPQLLAAARKASTPMGKVEGMLAISKEHDKIISPLVKMSIDKQEASRAGVNPDLDKLLKEEGLDRPLKWIGDDEVITEEVMDESMRATGQSILELLKIIDKSGGEEILADIIGAGAHTPEEGELDPRADIKEALAGNTESLNFVMGKIYRTLVVQEGMYKGFLHGYTTVEPGVDPQERINIFGKDFRNWNTTGKYDDMAGLLYDRLKHWKLLDDIDRGLPLPTLEDYLGSFDKRQVQSNLTADENILKEKVSLKEPLAEKEVVLASAEEEAVVEPVSPALPPSLTDSLMALETTEPESTISPLAEPDSAMAPVSVESLFSLVQPDTVEPTLPDTVETALDTLSAEEKDSFLASKDESRLPYDETTMEITAKDSAYIERQTQRFLNLDVFDKSEEEIRKDVTANVIDDKKSYQSQQNMGERLEHAIANLEKGDRAMAIAQRNILDRSLTAQNVAKEADIDNPQNMKDLWRVAKRDLKASKRAVKNYPSTYASDILQLSKTVERMRELDMNPAVAKEFKKLMKVLTSHTQNLSPEIVALIEDLRSLPTEGLINPFTGEPIGG